jgi:hypothetical protein
VSLGRQIAPPGTCQRALPTLRGAGQVHYGLGRNLGPVKIESRSNTEVIGEWELPERSAGPSARCHVVTTLHPTVTMSRVTRRGAKDAP